MGTRKKPTREQSETPTTPPSEVVQKYLDGRGWYASNRSSTDDDMETVFMLEFAAENAAAVPVKIIARDKAQQILFIAACPFIVPDSKKVAIIGKLTEINAVVAVGAFVLASEEKILTFRTGIDFIDAGVDITENILECQTKLTFETMDEFLPQFTEIFYAGGEVPMTLEDYFASRQLQ